MCCWVKICELKSSTSSAKRVELISLTGAVSLCSKPKTHANRLVTTTAIKTLGNRGLTRRSPTITANATTAMPSVGRWVQWNAASITRSMVSKWCSAFSTETPKILSSCDVAMMIAAALVKPLTTGWERKFTTSPRRAMPRRNWKIPTIIARRMA